MKAIIQRIRTAAILAVLFAIGLASTAWAATYSTYKDDATTFRTGAYGNANYQRFKINADWMFNTDDNDIAATADAVKLDSIKVYWHSEGHRNADIGKGSNEVDPYLVVTTPQGVIVGISAAGAKWTASGSSTFEFTDLVISPNAQYYYYFATDVSSLTVGGAMSGAKQARFTGAWHGANSGSATSDTTVCVMGEGKYSIRCDFEVSAATATTITTTSEGVSLSTGSDPVVLKGAVADGVVTVASGATVPTLTVVGEATTLKLTDSLTATYLYLPATTTIDASDVTFTMPGSDETEATTTLVSGKISAASNPSVTLPTPAEGYAFESPAYTDAGLAVTITKFANASLDIGGSTVNWSEVKPEGWVNSTVPTITVVYTDGGKIVLDENVQAASITLNGADKLTIERSEGVDVNISSLTFGNDDPANVEFVNFTRIPTFSQDTLSSDTIGISGTDTLTRAPSPISNNAAEGTLNFAQPLNFTGDGFYLFGNKTVNFNAGTDASFTRLVLGNSNGSKTQTVNQNAGTVTVTGNSEPTSNQASILLGHWGSTVALKTLGGTFTANNAISRLGWDGTATWAIGGGTSAATVNALGIQNGGNGHSGTGTLNILQNGTLNLGSGGINFQNSSNSGAINLAGGTIAASADLTIANSKAAGTILNQNKTTTINTGSNTVTLSARLSGAGALTKTGSGVLKVTGAGTATGGVTVSGGTLRFEGSGAKIGTGNINLTGEGAKLELAPGEGNTITLAPQFLVNSTGGNNTPVVEVGAGTVVIADTGSSANGHFGHSTINILNGGDMQLTKGDLLGYNLSSPINIASGGKLTVSKRETFTRNLNLNGGSVYLVKNDADDRALDLFNGMGTITVTADSSIDAATDVATIWVRRATANIAVNSGATLTLNAIVATTDSYADTNGGVTKSGDGTLKLTKANTSTGTLAVSAGVLELDGGSWAGPVALAAGTTLNVVTESEIGPGGTIATFGSGSTFGEGVVVQINGETVDDAAIDANGVVTRVVPVTKVTITVPTVANATVAVTVGGVAVQPITEGGNTYQVEAGSVVTVTYAAASGYAISGTTQYTIDTTTETTFEITDTATAQYVAQIRTGSTTYEKYTTLADALDSANVAYGITLLANVTETAVVVDSAVSISGNYTINSDVTIADGGSLQLMLATLNGTLTIQDGGRYVTLGGTLGNVVVQDGGIINLTTLSEDAAPLTVSTLTVNGALTIVSSYGLAERGKTYKAISYVTGNATIAEGASFNGKDEWSASTTVDGDNTVVCLAITKVAVVDGVYYDTAQEAVEAAVASGKQAQFLVQPGTVTLGAGETLVVKGSYQPTVALDEGLTTPPYSIESAYDQETFVYTYTAVQQATITDVTFNYMADYQSAKTVTATVSVPGTYTLTVGGNSYNATAETANSTITFNVNVTELSLGSNVDYTITAGGTASGTYNGNTTVGNVTDGWVVEDSGHYKSTGSWATDFTYTDGKATLTDNTYTANRAGDGIVTLTTVVKFGGDSDPEVVVGPDAQAAVRVQNSKFEVYGKATSDGTAGWQSTEVDAEVDATYTVKLIINYNTRTFTISVKKNGAETATALGGTWHLATVATKVSSIAYKGTGGFTSLTGSFISGDVGVTVDETNVAVSSDFISAYLAGKTVTEAAAALAPDATPESNPAAFAAGGNGINYFKCYALGLDPTKADDKPIVDVTVEDGKYVFTVKHPVYNEQGEITGYDEINAADNVSTTVTLKYGTGAASLSGSATGAAISPAEMFSQDGLNGSNVIYYKAEVSIRAK